MWRRLRNTQICGVRFHRQYSVGAFVLDFYAPSVRLAIELDGASHDGEEAAMRDAYRQKIIEGYDISFLRFTDSTVTTDIDQVLGLIEAEVRRRLEAKEPEAK